MQAIRFNQTVNSHDIVIPFDMLKSLNHQEVDIIVFPKKSDSSLLSAKNTLAAIFKQYKNIRPFKEITDPVSWQKNLRNEW